MQLPGRLVVDYVALFVVVSHANNTPIDQLRGKAGSILQARTLTQTLIGSPHLTDTSCGTQTPAPSRRISPATNSSRCLKRSRTSGATAGKPSRMAFFVVLHGPNPNWHRCLQDDFFVVLLLDAYAQKWNAEAPDLDSNPELKPRPLPLCPGP